MAKTTRKPAKPRAPARSAATPASAGAPAPAATGAGGGRGGRKPSAAAGVAPVDLVAVLTPPGRPDPTRPLVLLPETPELLAHLAAVEAAGQTRPWGEPAVDLPGGPPASSPDGLGRAAPRGAPPSAPSVGQRRGGAEEPVAPVHRSTGFPVSAPAGGLVRGRAGPATDGIAVSDRSGAGAGGSVGAGSGPALPGIEAGLAELRGIAGETLRDEKYRNVAPTGAPVGAGPTAPRTGPTAVRRVPAGGGAVRGLGRAAGTTGAGAPPAGSAAGGGDGRSSGAVAPAAPLVGPADDSFEKIRADALACQGCSLHATRTNLVFGEGNPRAKLVFIGEAPGADEDATGRPFVGRAGQLLDQILAATGIPREEVFIGNILKDRPPGNRTPTMDEMKACGVFLRRQLALIKPQLIAMLGNTAIKYLIGPDAPGITRILGQWQTSIFGIPALPLYHPSYLLRYPNREPGSPKWQMWQAMKLLKARYDALR